MAYFYWIMALTAAILLAACLEAALDRRSEKKAEDNDPAA